MPVKKKPEPLQTWGIPLNLRDQLSYDRCAFGRRWHGVTEAQRPALFRRISDSLLPKHFMWHSWMNKIVDAGCRHQIICIPGCSNCVAADTRIDNPITGERPTIAELCERQEYPVVMTLSGPVRAEVPYFKGSTLLYELRLRNGRSFVASAGHRVLVSSTNSTHWSRCDELEIGQYLVEYERDLHQSNSEPFPSIHSSSGILEPPHFYPEIPEPSSRWFQQHGQFRSMSDDFYPYPEPVHDVFRTQSLGYRVGQTQIVSIKEVGVRPYYDLCVPGVHHYFANGTIHHNSGKTFGVASFMCVWWLCWPEESSAMFISTTAKSLRRRGWSEISNIYSKIHPKIGNFVNSEMMWQIEGGDAKHAIYGKAVEDGTQSRIADDIKGIHTRRQAIVIDEATAVSGAIYDAISNLYSYPEEFLLFIMGNPRNRLDLFGRMIEPKGGWTTVTVDSEEWEGKPQAEYGGITPQIIRFDAEKSPNILAGKTICRHLPTQKKVDAQRNAAGGQTPLWWSNFRGFPPPEGLEKTVFTESAIITHGGFGNFTFTGKDFQILGFFDHARNGGDRPTLRFAKMGEVIGGFIGIEMMKPQPLGIDANSTTPIDYQLASFIKRAAESIKLGGVEYHCPPQNFGVDATGAGASFTDTLQRLWSPKVMRILFSAAASDDPVSMEDTRPAKEVYENKRAEMFFRARNALDSDQLRGIDKDTAQELCTIEFDDMGRKRIVMMLKEDYKKKFGKSPDLGDTLVGVVEVARRLNFKLAAIGETINKTVEWNRQVDIAQSVYEPADAFQPETDLDFEHDYL